MRVYQAGNCRGAGPTGVPCALQAWSYRHSRGSIQSLRVLPRTVSAAGEDWALTAMPVNPSRVNDEFGDKPIQTHLEVGTGRCSSVRSPKAYKTKSFSGPSVPGGTPSRGSYADAEREGHFWCTADTARGVTTEHLAALMKVGPLVGHVCAMRDTLGVSELWRAVGPRQQP